MRPCENPPSALQNQETSAQRRRAQRLARRPRTRRCLLKGCERRYHPRRGLQRYCSYHCREAARAWSRWKAQERYRATPTGQEKRRAQSQRYRERVRRKKEQPLEAAGAVARVITTDFFRDSCDRPGCYESFVRSQRSPLQRFCSKECRRALQRVWERERRWQERRQVKKGQIRFTYYATDEFPASSGNCFGDSPAILTALRRSISFSLATRK